MWSEIVSLGQNEGVSRAALSAEALERIHVLFLLQLLEAASVPDSWPFPLSSKLEALTCYSVTLLPLLSNLCLCASSKDLCDCTWAPLDYPE